MDTQHWFCALQPSLQFYAILIIIIITEHLILRPKMQANSKAHAFLLPIMFNTEIDEFSAFF